jgi:predicted enzyme related to lactoylglutathione lyase
MGTNCIVKVTLRSTDFERTRLFYNELFGWKFHQYSPTYLGFETPSGIDGGFQRVDSFSQGDSYLLYIRVDQFEPYLRRIPELQGSSKGDVEVVSEFVAYVRFYDPDGNRWALLRTTGQDESKKT